MITGTLLGTRALVSRRAMAGAAVVAGTVCCATGRRRGWCVRARARAVFDPFVRSHLTSDQDMLRELDCSNNALEELPHALGLLKRLHTLRCDHNQLEALPPVLAR